MKAHLTKVSLAILSAAFVLGCQDVGTGVVASDGPGPQFMRGGNGKPDASFYSVVAVAGQCPVSTNTWISTMPGVPTGSSLSPRWAPGDLTVTVDGLLLEGRAIAGVGIHKGEVDWVNLSIGDADTGIRYTTGKIPFTTIGSLQDDGSAPDGFIISGPRTTTSSMSSR